MKVHVYVEGGGTGKDLRPRCREAFSRLFERAGVKDRMPRITACGARDAAYDDFITATSVGKADGYPILLVDSEEPVTSPPWSHLEARDGWTRPQDVEDEQAQLMVTCMETWVVADPGTLQRVFGPSLTKSALPPLNDLENREKSDVQDRLERATRGCGEDRKYKKGRRSFQVVNELDPTILEERLPHFQRLVETLRNRC